MAADSRTKAIATQGTLVLLVLLATALLVSVLPAQGSGAASRRVDVVVRFDASVSPARRADVVRAAGGRDTRDLHIIDAVGARLPADVVPGLRGVHGVRSVAIAVPVHSRGTATAGRPLNAYPSAIGATELWDHGRGLTGRGVGVAVIDTGIDAGLPDFDDLRARSGSRGDTRADSRVVASAVVNPDATGDADGYGHGTHVAGIIAGNGINRDAWRNASQSSIGVAPEARLINVKIADDEGKATTLDAIYGLQFAVDHAKELGIRVVNLSLASTVAESPASDPLDAAAEAAWLHGLVVVAAAGNEGDAPDAVAHAPGNDPYVVTVGAADDQGTASDDDDRLAEWSSRGVTQTGQAKPDLLAPGAHIVSTLARGSRFGELCPDCVVDGDYFQAGGTSMATAVVSGSAALILQAHPDWTPDQVKAALTDTTEDVPGTGREVRVDRAVDAAPDDEESAQRFPVNPLVDPATGDIDSSAASWRAASWRSLDSAAASWRCVCDADEDGAVDPSAASWRAASWRTSFTK